MLTTTNNAAVAVPLFITQCLTAIPCCAYKYKNIACNHIIIMQKQQKKAKGDQKLRRFVK